MQKIIPKKIKLIILNWLFKEEIEEIYHYRQVKSQKDFGFDQIQHLGVRTGIDIAMQKLGANNLAYKFIKEAEIEFEELNKLPKKIYTISGQARKK